MLSVSDPEKTRSDFVRSLDHAEANFWLYDHVSSMNFACMALGVGDLNAENIRSGLDSVQARHPLARVGIERKYGVDPHLCFVSTPESKIPLSVQSISPDWKTRLAKESMRGFRSGEAPLIRAIFYESDEKRNWVFALVFHHSISDGRSGCRFLSEVLQAAVSKEKSGNCSQDHHPSLMDLYSAEGRAKERMLEEKPVCLPRFSRRLGEPEPKILDFRLDSEEIRALVSKGREKGISLHGILGAAQIYSFYDFFPSDISGILNLSTPADLRPYLSRSVPDSALGLYITLLTTQLKIGTPFWSLAKRIKEDLVDRLSRKEGRAFYELLPPPEQFLQREDGLRIFASLMSRIPQTSVLSNLGVLPPAEIRGLDLKEISFTVHPSLNQTLFITATTFRDRLTLNINYDSNRWEPEEIRRYVSNFHRCLLKYSY
ncbi:condensation protein [Leptospira fluminis]|uniref:Phthiocerol/phthiodiolone dimycocerosyl transferase n=1 Tax=Leptospira fluminis TaxID=2484979 RepID=A0A4R9GKN5_9LEPT|nr:condensation domain-containing protein [Leptospira fluminis]TGK15109.1 condensation protein [Leptospira fluminis]